MNVRATYATDGKCHNAEPGSFNHECGKPAVWVGTKANGFRSGFCDDCKKRGYEARYYQAWEKIFWHWHGGEAAINETLSTPGGLL